MIASAGTLRCVWLIHASGGTNEDELQPVAAAQSKVYDEMRYGMKESIQGIVACCYAEVDIKRRVLA